MAGCKENEPPRTGGARHGRAEERGGDSVAGSGLGSRSATKEKADISKPSYKGSLPLVTKAFVMLFLGCLLTSNLFPSHLTSVMGVFLSCVALTAWDCIRHDCANGIFFPSRMLNKCTNYVLNLVLNNWLGILLMGMVIATLQHLISTASTWTDVVYSLNYFAIPCMIVRLHMLVEEKTYDYKEKDSRADEKTGGKPSPAKKSQNSVDRLLPGLSSRLESWMRIADEVSGPTPTKSPSDLNNLTLPFDGVRFSGVPLYAVNNFAASLEKDLAKLVEGLQLELEQQISSSAVFGCSLPKLERMESSAGGDSVADFDDSNSVAEEPDTQEGADEGMVKPVSAFKTTLVSTLRFLLAPLRLAFSSIFLWKKRDIALYAVVAVYLFMIYVGFHYFSYTPVCVLFGLFGPKSKAGRFMQKKWDSTMLRTAPDGTPTLNRFAPTPGTADAGADSQVHLTTMQRLRNAILGQYKLNIFMCMYMGMIHVMAIHSIIVLICFGGQDYLINMVGEAAPPVKWETLLFALLLWPISGLGITAGAHRLWAHKSYDAHCSLRLFLMLCNSIAHQGSIFHWVRDHRTHHLHSDTAADPHDRNRGFFYAHMGWLLVKKPEAVINAGKAVDISDLKKDNFVMFQKAADPWWNFIWAFAVPGYVSLFFWNDTLWNGFLFAGVLRYVYVLHCTWAVNSIVHSDLFGNPSPYDEDSPPSESKLVSFLALGEGWHSWHHAYPFDYAAAELGGLEQYNPTKLFLDLCALLGLVRNRKTGHRMWAEKKGRLLRRRAEEMGEEAENVECVEELEGPPLGKMRKLTYRRKRQAPGVKSSFDTIASAEEWERAADMTKEKVMVMIPAELKTRSGWTSTLYLIRTCTYCVLAFAAFYFMQQIEIDTRVSLGGGAAAMLGVEWTSIPVSISVPALLEGSPAFHFLFWGLYAVTQGTLMTGLWVIGHECGHGAYSESAWLNDAVGMATHTFLLVPYYAWQYTHVKHHKFTNHLTRGETHVPPANPTWLNRFCSAVAAMSHSEDLVATPIGVAAMLVLGWPLYLIFNITGGRTNWKDGRIDKNNGISHFFAGMNSELFPPSWTGRINISTVSLVCMLAVLAVWSDMYGRGHMLKWYLFPYLVVNAWLVLYTWLHHTHEEVPHYGDESFSWLRGALSTVDRSYPRVIDHVHLNIGSTHVLHHLSPKIPHYHAKAATEILRDSLGPLYRYDDRSIVSAVWSTFKKCHYVDKLTGLQFYRAYKGS